MARRIDYGKLMHDAMRGLIRQVLADVAADGLPGEHHFFVTFDTNHAEAGLADWLRERYPDEMTIVIQHWFEDLEVREDGFSITLNFGDNPERLDIPFDALRTFVDPSVEFGLRFESQEDEEDADEDAPMAEDVEAEAEKPDAEVVSLDSFRK
ncbi:MAG: ClpXP protease specificity-enhancing factor SspB [Pseudomonadota bacterium]